MSCAFSARRRKGVFSSAHSDDPRSYLGRTHSATGPSYLDEVSRLWPFLSKYGLDLVIVAVAVQSAIGTALRDDPQRPDGLLLWLEVALMAAIVLALLGRHRFPFAAPAALWLSTAALSFLDGVAVVAVAGIFLAGMGAALLLGNLRRDVQARVGLVLVVGGAAVLIRGSAGAIVAYFVYALVLPNIFVLLASSQDWFADLQPWVDLNYAQGFLFIGTLTGEQWANLAVTATIWLVLPAALGLRLVMRSEVK